MKDMKKVGIKYLAIILASFLVGILFSQYVLLKYFDFSDKVVDKHTVPENSKVSPVEVIKSDKSLSIERGCSIYVDVSGAVREPGVYCLDSEALVIDAVNKAGGFSKGIALSFVSRNINLALPLTANQKIYFPLEKEVECKLLSFLPQVVTSSSNQSSGSESSGTQTSNSAEGGNTSEQGAQCVNINDASKSELTSLNGIGEVTAEKIILGRPYTKIEDLLNVSGIGDATLNKFKDAICI